MPILTPAMVREAARRIRPLAHRTPVMTSRILNAACGCEVFLKCENLQRGGAFKIRGAANLIFSILQVDLPRGVVAFSSGNHAQAVAIAAEHVGAPATIVMPLDAPRSKVEATRAHGATIVTYDRFRQDREQLAAEILDQQGATLAPPYDHPLIMAGQGTTALELMEDCPDLDALVVCVGGGGIDGRLLDHRAGHAARDPPLWGGTRAGFRHRTVDSPRKARGDTTVRNDRGWATVTDPRQTNVSYRASTGRRYFAGE